MTRYRLISLVLIASLVEAQAAIRLPLVIGDHMVLQRSIHASIWGWADPDEEVLVSFREQRKTARTRADGKWKIILDLMEAGGPFEMRIEGKDKVVLKDTLAGEVGRPRRTPKEIEPVSHNLPLRGPVTLTTFNSNCQTGRPTPGKMSTRPSRKASQANLKVLCAANMTERKEDARSLC